MTLENAQNTLSNLKFGQTVWIASWKDANALCKALGDNLGKTVSYHSGIHPETKREGWMFVRHGH